LRPALPVENLKLEIVERLVNAFAIEIFVKYFGLESKILLNRAEKRLVLANLETDFFKLDCLK